MEHILINELLEFIGKSGGEMINQLTNGNNNPRVWTESDMDDN